MAMRQQVALLPEKIAQGVAERTAELEKVCERERRIAEVRLVENNKLTQSYNSLLKKSQNDKKSYEATLSQKNYIIANLISAFQKAIELLDVVCRKALKAVIDFAKKTIARRFTYEQACAVNEFIDKGSDRRRTADTLITLSRPFFTETNTPREDRMCRMWPATFQSMKELKRKSKDGTSAQHVG